ncbi:phosphoribosyltransferase [Nostoc sp. CMAA1605]|uniref:phosphoribosyltransferase n=1 Tax=Nostoc sp. CMAA1605 TaxID=2055159 RepID=UPI001F458B82|nr:phosphoribosyltransferase [Nostoc sp. CMAA1605]MCF4968033.1 phosphoribosyl transferase [Nostoc sp. CMAA1605]
MRQKFRDRTEAGKLLAAKLTAYTHHDDVLVLALPRGGVPVGYEVAKQLNAPLDICLVRKLGVPEHRELAMGAISLGKVRVINQSVVDLLGISPATIDSVAATEQLELNRRYQLYQGDRPLPNIQNQTIILVDDGIATGATIKAAIATIKQQQPRELIVAVPVAGISTCEELAREVDQVICVLMVENLYAIGIWYEDFAQTTDTQVRELLAKSIQHHRNVIYN